MEFIHRDVKPDNIVLDSRGHCRLAGKFKILKSNIKNTKANIFNKNFQILVLV